MTLAPCIVAGFSLPARSTVPAPGSSALHLATLATKSFADPAHSSVNRYVPRQSQGVCYRGDAAPEITPQTRPESRPDSAGLPALSEPPYAVCINQGASEASWKNTLLPSDGYTMSFVLRDLVYTDWNRLRM
jgi:hypothetical protein